MRPVRSICILLLSLTTTGILEAQSISQTIRGSIVDRDTQEALIGANIIVRNTDPTRGATSDHQGAFWIHDLPVGRYDLQVSYIGYEPYIASEILLSSAKEVVLNIQLKSSYLSVDEVVVEGSNRKEVPQNSMATVSARTFTVEEARRYAGGMDDPARLAASFAGVSTGAPQDNAIIVRGNSAKGLLWQVEGVRIPSPNHFPDINVAGGGFVSVLSSHVLANSDFYTGAFPAEYGNALAGVFDMHLRDGNHEKQEYTFQAGVLGLDLAAEGPLPGLQGASYLFNYRYSTFSLIKDFIPSEQIPEYSDLAYKVTIPTEKYGKFSLWGLRSIDLNVEPEEPDSSLWTNPWDRIAYDLDMGMNVVGLNHKLLLARNAYLKTSIAKTVQFSTMNMYRLDDDLVLQENYMAKNNSGNLTVSSYINTRISANHTNRSGVIINKLDFEFDQSAALDNRLPLTKLVDQKDSDYLMQAYSQSRFALSPRLQLNTGFHVEHFGLSGETVFEPRVGLNMSLSSTQNLSLGYGNHSQMEELRVYYVLNNSDGHIIQPNTELELSRAHHLVLAFQQKLSPGLHLKLEPYFQHAYNVPVIQDSSFSMLNFKQDLNFNSPLVNEGTGQNYGLDITLERFLQKNMYYLMTISLFSSTYIGGDGIERRTRYDSGYVINALFGKEILLGQAGQNRLGVNLKLKAVGGGRRSPVDIDRTITAREIRLDETRAFEEREPTQTFLDISLTYRKNKPSYSSMWALQIMNALGSTSLSYYDYDYQMGEVSLVKEIIVVPSLSYKIEF